MKTKMVDLKKIREINFMWLLQMKCKTKKDIQKDKKRDKYGRSNDIKNRSNEETFWMYLVIDLFTGQVLSTNLVRMSVTQERGHVLYCRILRYSHASIMVIVSTCFVLRIHHRVIIMVIINRDHVLRVNVVNILNRYLVLTINSQSASNSENRYHESASYYPRPYTSTELNIMKIRHHARNLVPTRINIVIILIRDILLLAMFVMINLLRNMARLTYLIHKNNQNQLKFL